MCDVNFGVNPGFSGIRYVQSVVPSMDGLVVIQEAAPKANKTSPCASWAWNGVDVSIHLHGEDMHRLI
jgi:hypothetical protein